MSFTIEIFAIKHFAKFAKVISEIKRASFGRMAKTKCSRWYATDFKSDECQFEGYNCGVCGNYLKLTNLKGYPKSVRKVILCVCKAEEKEESESEEEKPKPDKKSKESKSSLEETSPRLLGKKTKKVEQKVENPKKELEFEDTEGKGLCMKKYSEKSFAIYGDTKKYKEDLKSLGGKFNMNLRGGQGWIFRATDAVKVSKWIEEDNE